MDQATAIQHAKNALFSTWHPLQERFKGVIVHPDEKTIRVIRAQPLEDMSWRVEIAHQHFTSNSQLEGRIFIYTIKDDPKSAKCDCVKP